MPERILIHHTIDPETGESLKDYYTQIPIQEGVEFDVQYGPCSLKFKMIEHWITDERHALVELISVTEQPTSRGLIPKRPIVGEQK
jgi:hypothetical protein